MQLDMKGFAINSRCSDRCTGNAQRDWSVVLAEKSKLKNKLAPVNKQCWIKMLFIKKKETAPR